MESRIPRISYQEAAAMYYTAERLSRTVDTSEGGVTKFNLKYMANFFQAIAGDELPEEHRKPL